MNSLICCILKKQIMLIFHLDSGKSSQVFGSTRVFRCNCASDGTLLAAWMKNEAWRILGLRCLEAHPFRVVLLMRQVVLYRTKKKREKLFCKVSLSPSSGNEKCFHIAAAALKYLDMFVAEVSVVATFVLKFPKAEKMPVGAQRSLSVSLSERNWYNIAQAVHCT